MEEAQQSVGAPATSSSSPPRVVPAETDAFQLLPMADSRGDSPRDRAGASSPASEQAPPVFIPDFPQLQSAEEAQEATEEQQQASRPFNVVDIVDLTMDTSSEEEEEGSDEDDDEDEDGDYQEEEEEDEEKEEEEDDDDDDDDQEELWHEDEAGSGLESTASDTTWSECSSSGRGPMVAKKRAAAGRGGSMSGRGRMRQLPKRLREDQEEVAVLRGRAGGRPLSEPAYRSRSSQRFPCTACGETIGGPEEPILWHPLLVVPVCKHCHKTYHTGSFVVDGTNEIFCRWCGDGGDLLFCDFCDKSLCQGCMARNFGQREVLRIKGLEGVWACILCNPKPLDALRRRCASTWGLSAERQKELLGRRTGLHKRRGGGAGQGGSRAALPGEESRRDGDDPYGGVNVVCADIALGREPVAIPAVNDVDHLKFPGGEFVYVSDFVHNGAALHVDTSPSFMCSCDCTDNCQDPMTCACAALMGHRFPYGFRGQLVEPHLAIYECHELCSCHQDGCKNRVVGNGVKLRLEVFRCGEPGKGWGVRCVDPIPAGSFICNYVGELMPESMAEERGRLHGDEYLFSLDMFAADMARLRLEQANLKAGYEVEDYSDHLLHPPPATLAANGQQAAATALPSPTEGPCDTTQVTAPTAVTSPPSPPGRGPSEHGRPTATPRSSSSGSSTAFSPWRRPPVAPSSGLGLGAEAEAERIWNSTIRQVELQHGRCVDAKFFGNVARFINHSCEPNLIKQVVFTDSQDVRRPRVCFFAGCYIPAREELTYDYGYTRGTVAGKSLACLCKAKSCRKQLY